MLEDTPKRLVQPTISAYFRGFKGIQTPEKIKKKGKMGNRRKSLESDGLTPSESSSMSSYLSRAEKRKLIVQIFSEDEDDSENDYSSNNRAIESKAHSVTKSPEKKPVTMISLNKPAGQASPPKKPSLINWTPPSNTISSVREPASSFRDISPQDPCCSKILQPDKSPKKSASSNTICVLSNQIIRSPIKKTTPPATGTNSPKEEKKKLNYSYLEVMETFFRNIVTNKSLKCLLTHGVLAMLQRFFEMERDYQFLCVKLFMWKPIWYNIFKYAVQIGLDLTITDSATMYNCLKDNQFIETDYLGEDLFTLLNLLNLKDLREINRSFKFNNASGSSKDIIITRLLKNCQTQVTLTLTKSTEQVLRERIHEKLGMCCKLSKSLRQALFNVYLLNTYTNPNIMNPKDYFKDTNIVFPAYRVESYHIFYTEQEFSEYSSAVELRQALDEAVEKKSTLHITEICNLAFDMLQRLKKTFDPYRPRYLERFTAQAQYVSILSLGSNHVTSSDHNAAKRWLQYLISQDFCTQKRGDWYCQLSLIYTKYLKDYKAAAKLVISAFEKEKEHLSEVQLYEVTYRGKLLQKKSYNIPTLFHDQIVAAAVPSCERVWPTVVVESKTVRSNEPGRKRKYVSEEANGDVRYMTVEQTALEHYLNTGYTEGEHCEGSLVRAAFCLLFFDVIYNSYVKGTFVSEMQNVPLDMYTRYFYANRENSIKQRIDEIKGMREEELKRSMMDKWEKHSHESLLCPLENTIENLERLSRAILCIGAGVLVRIFERLVKDYKTYHSGFPDLIVWHFQEKKAKFVEVKGENDTLSIKQKLWLNYLMDSGADVELCHIHSIGSKRKVIAKKKLE